MKLSKRKGPLRASDRTSASGAYKTPFAAAAVQPTRESCEAAKAIAGDRYLLADVPLIPLKACDRPMACPCRYTHYADRRAGPRRRTEGALPRTADGYVAERRRVPDRRTE